MKLHYPTLYKVITLINGFQPDITLKYCLNVSAPVEIILLDIIYINILHFGDVCTVQWFMQHVLYTHATFSVNLYNL